MTRIALLCSLALLGASYPVAAKEAPQAAAKPAVSKVMGTVEAFDAATNKLTVKDKKGQTKEFTLGADVKVTRVGKKAAAAELTAGDKVTVQLTGDQVTSVTAKPAKKTKS